MGDAKGTLKEKALRGMREYFFISLYLWVVFALLVLYKSVILAEQGIDFEPQGWALINALAMGKVAVVAQELRLAEQFKDAPLIYPTLLKSAAFTLVLACFKILEQAIVGAFREKSFHAAMQAIGGGTWKGVLSLTVILFVLLIPFFGFAELRRVFGDDQLRELFFRSRKALPLP